MTIFLKDIEGLRNFEPAKALLTAKNVPFKERVFPNGIRAISITNTDAKILTTGIGHGIRGGNHFYYLPGGDYVLIENGYGFNGRGQPHSRSTRASVFHHNGERYRDAEKEFQDYGKTEFKDMTVSQMEAILKSKTFEMAGPVVKIPKAVKKEKTAAAPVSTLENARAAKTLLGDLNRRNFPSKQTLSKTASLTKILEEMNLDTEDLDETARELELIIIQEEVSYTGARRELLERHVKYGENGTGEICQRLLDSEVNKPAEEFYKEVEQKVDFFTHKEENSNSDADAQKYADICSLYVSMLNILDNEIKSKSEER